MCTASQSWTSLRNCLAAVTMVLWLLQTFCFLFCDISGALGLRVILYKYLLTMDIPGYLFSAFWQVVDCLKILSICWKKKLLWWGVRVILLWENRISKQQKVFWFRKMTVIDSPLGSIASPFTERWQVLSYQSWIPSYWTDLKSN